MLSIGRSRFSKKLCEVLMDFIDSHEDLKRYWEENINVDCCKKDTIVAVLMSDDVKEMISYFGR